MPTRLAKRFAKAMADPNLMSLQQDIGLVAGRLGQLVEKFPTQESAEAWAVVHDLTARLDGLADALSVALERAAPAPSPTSGLDLEPLEDPPTPDPGRAAVADLRTVAVGLQEACALAGAERAIWGELYEAMEQMRRLNDTERRREEALQTIVTARQGQALFGALLATIIEEVTDVPTKRRVLQRLRALLVHGDRSPSDVAEIVALGAPAAARDDAAGGPDPDPAG